MKSTDDTVKSLENLGTTITQKYLASIVEDDLI